MSGFWDELWGLLMGTPPQQQKPQKPQKQPPSLNFPHVPNGRWEVSQSSCGQALLCLWVKRRDALNGNDLYLAGPLSWEPGMIQAMVPVVLRDYAQACAERERARQRNAARCADAQRRSQQLGVPIQPYQEQLNAGAG